MLLSYIHSHTGISPREIKHLTLGLLGTSTALDRREKVRQGKAKSAPLHCIQWRRRSCCYWLQRGKEEERGLALLLHCTQWRSRDQEEGEGENRPPHCTQWRRRSYCYWLQREKEEGKGVALLLHCTQWRPHAQEKGEGEIRPWHCTQ